MFHYTDYTNTYPSTSRLSSGDTEDHVSHTLQRPSSTSAQHPAHSGGPSLAGQSTDEMLICGQSHVFVTADRFIETKTSLYHYPFPGMLDELILFDPFSHFIILLITIIDGVDYWEPREPLFVLTVVPL